MPFLGGGEGDVVDAVHFQGCVFACCCSMGRVLFEEELLRNLIAESIGEDPDNGADIPM